MEPLYKFKHMRVFFAGILALTTLASCSSYQYSGYDSDGIYSSQDRRTLERPDQNRNNHTQSTEDALYYKQLFGQQAEQMEAVAQNGMIFTDVDNYTSTGSYDEETYGEEGINYTGGYAAWGSDPDEISINIYNNGFYDPFYGPAIGGFYGHGYGYGFYGRPWNRFGPGYWPGYGRFGFAYGHSFGPGYYSPWGWRIGWGPTWNHWGYNYHHSPYLAGGWYNNPYRYNRNDVAYNNTRRGSYVNNDALNTRRSNLSNTRSSRISDYSNTRNVRATSRSNRNTDARTYSTRTRRVESPLSRSRSRSNSTYRSSNTRSYDTNTRARAARETRSNTYSNQVRRSTNNTRSSGTVRSSSSRSRSSGTSSGSSRGSRGRGN